MFFFTLSRIERKKGHLKKMYIEISENFFQNHQKTKEIEFVGHKPKILACGSYKETKTPSKS